MTTLWTVPKTWATNDPITKDELNKINNNIKYLYAPSIGIATIRGTAVDVSITSTSPQAIDDANLGVSVEYTGRLSRCKFQTVFSNSTLGTLTSFDVLIDNTTYLSSLTGTPLTNGVWRQRQFVAAYPMQVVFDVIIPAGVLSNAVHTFVPRAWVTANTSTILLSANTFTQFVVGEF